MRHLVSGRQLGVDNSHRIALLRSLSLALIERDAIRTTTARAKELRWYADRIVTLGKRGDLHSRRLLVKLLGATVTNTPGKNRVQLAIRKVYDDLVPRFKDRTGGYTQIMHLATPRAGDKAPMVLMRYIPVESPKAGKKSDGKDKGKKKVQASDKKEKKVTAEAAAPQGKPAKPKKTKKAEDKE